MAVPDWLFETKFGVAVMRQTGGEWFFECWATKASIVRDLGEGNHTFALWLICGNSCGRSSIQYEGWSSIYAMRARK